MRHGAAALSPRWALVLKHQTTPELEVSFRNLGLNLIKILQVRVDHTNIDINYQMQDLRVDKPYLAAFEKSGTVYCFGPAVSWLFSLSWESQEEGRITTLHLSVRSEKRTDKSFFLKQKLFTLSSKDISSTRLWPSHDVQTPKFQNGQNGKCIEVNDDGP